MDDHVVTDVHEPATQEDDVESLQQSEAYAINQVKGSSAESSNKKKASEDPTGYTITGNPEDQSTSPILSQWPLKLIGGGVGLAILVILLGIFAPRRLT